MRQPAWPELCPPPHTLSLSLSVSVALPFGLSVFLCFLTPLCVSCACALLRSLCLSYD